MIELRRGKVASARHRAQRRFGDDRAALAERNEQFQVLRRVRVIQPASNNADCARLQRAAMGGGIDASRESGDYGVAGGAEVSGDPLSQHQR